MSDDNHSKPIRYTTNYTDYAKRWDWCRANGYKVWPNGWIGPDACSAYRQAEIEAEAVRRGAGAGAYTESLVTR